MTIADLLRSEAPRPRALRAVGLALAALVAFVALYPPVAEYDFCTYYTAGLLTRAGAPAEAFDQDALNRRHDALHGTARRKGPFLYSPLYLLPAAGLAGLPFAAAERVNQGAALLCLSAALALLLLRVAGAVAQVALAVAFVLAQAVTVQFIYGNWSFLLLLLVAAAWGASRAGERWTWPAALAWALAIHLKPFVALAVVALALGPWWRLALRTVLAGAALALLPLPWVGGQSYAAFAGRALGGTAQGVLPFYNNISIFGAVGRLFTEPRAWVAPRAPVDGLWVSALGLFAAALLTWALGRARREPERALAVALLGLLLFFPLVWDHTAILLFAVLPLLARREQLLFAALLAATALYGPWHQRALQMVLHEAAPPGPLRLVLLVPAAVNLLLLAAVLAAPAARVPESGSG